MRPDCPVAPSPQNRATFCASARRSRAHRLAPAETSGGLPTAFFALRCASPVSSRRVNVTVGAAAAQPPCSRGDLHPARRLWRPAAPPRRPRQARKTSAAPKCFQVSRTGPAGSANRAFPGSIPSLSPPESRLGSGLGSGLPLARSHSSREIAFVPQVHERGSCPQLSRATERRRSPHESENHPAVGLPCVRHRSVRAERLYDEKAPRSENPTAASSGLASISTWRRWQLPNWRRRSRHISGRRGSHRRSLLSRMQGPPPPLHLLSPRTSIRVTTRHRRSSVMWHRTPT